MNSIDFDSKITDIKNLLILLYDFCLKENESFEHSSITQQISSLLYNDISQPQYFESSFLNQIQDNIQQLFPQYTHLQISLYFALEIQAQNWPELNYQKKFFGAIGIFDLNSHDNYDKFDKQYQRFKKILQENQINFYLVILLNSQSNNELQEQFILNIQSQFQNINFCLIENIQNMGNQIRDQLQKLIQNIILNLICQELKDINQEKQTSIVLFNIKEEKMSDIKLKKKKQGRIFKICGDLNMKLFNFQSALQFYNNAIEHLKQNNDYIWMASAYEGLSAQIFSSAEQISAIKSQEIIKNMKEAVKFYQKGKDIELTFESLFKLLQFSFEYASKENFNEIVKYSFENFPPFNKYLNTIQISKLFNKIAKFYLNLGMKRKSLNILYLFLQQIKSVLPLGSNNLQLSILYACIDLLDISHILQQQQNNKQLFQQQQQFCQQIKASSSVQLYFLKEMLLINENIEHQQQILIYIIQNFQEFLSKDEISFFFQQLNQNSIRINKVINGELYLYPEIYRVIIKPQFKRYFIEKLQENQCIQKDEKQIFLYSPWQKKKQQQITHCPINESLIAQIYMNNVFDYNISFEVFLLFENLNFIEQFPLQVYLPPKAQNYDVQLQFKSKSLGICKVIGIIIRAFNIEYINKLDNNGLSINYINRHGLSYINKMLKIKQQEPLQLIDIQIIKKQPYLCMILQDEYHEYNEKFFLTNHQSIMLPIQIINKSLIPVKIISMTISFDFQLKSIVEQGIYKEVIQQIEDNLNQKQNCILILLEDQSNLNEYCQIQLLDEIVQNKHDLKKISINCTYESLYEDSFINELKFSKEFQINLSLDIFEISFLERITSSTKLPNLQYIQLNQQFYLKIKIINWQENQIFFCKFKSQLFEEINSSLEFIIQQNFVEKIFLLNKLDPSQVKQNQLKEIFYLEFRTESNTMKGKISLTDNNIQKIININKIYQNFIKISNVIFKQNENEQTQNYQLLENEITTLSFTIEYDFQSELETKLKCSIDLEPVIGDQNHQNMEQEYDHILYQGLKDFDFILINGKNYYEYQIQLLFVSCSQKYYNLTICLINEQNNIVYQYLHDKTIQCI